MLSQLSDAQDKVRSHFDYIKKGSLPYDSLILKGFAALSVLEGVYTRVFMKVPTSKSIFWNFVIAAPLYYYSSHLVEEYYHEQGYRYAIGNLV